MAERLTNLGYFALIKETVKGTPQTPTDFIPLYDETFSTVSGFVDQQPITGQKFNTYTVLQGQRSHTGDITVIAEPNTIARLFDSLMTKVSTTGSAPYVHTYAFSNTANPNSYTVDISSGNIVNRYWGFESSKFSVNWNSNEMQAKISASALGSFQSREIASVATTTLTLKTDYDPAPTKGLVIGDLVRIYKSSTGATLDTTIASVAGDGITVTLGASAAAFAAGDAISLRPAPVVFNNLQSFLWSKTFFQPGLTAAASLTNAQLRVEQGSSFEIMHNFESNAGAARSGGFDPAALVRTTADANFNIKRLFDTPEDILLFNNLAKNAWTIRHYAGTTNQYEFRVIFNNVRTDGVVVPDMKANGINYSDLKYHPAYDQTDAQAVGVVIINNLATI